LQGDFIIFTLTLSLPDKKKYNTYIYIVSVWVIANTAGSIISHATVISIAYLASPDSSGSLGIIIYFLRRKYPAGKAAKGLILSSVFNHYGVSWRYQFHFVISNHGSNMSNRSGVALISNMVTIYVMAFVRWRMPSLNCYEWLFKFACKMSTW